jgi:hypothetical protein
MSHIEPFELVFNNNKDEGIHSGGFSVNSIMMKKGISPIKTLNTDEQTGGNKVSDLFDNIVVPNWAYSSGKMFGANNEKHDDTKYEQDSDEDDYISDDIHEKLLDLVKHHDTKMGGNKKKTTRKKMNRKGGTKKNKKTKK